MTVSDLPPDHALHHFVNCIVQTRDMSYCDKRVDHLYDFLTAYVFDPPTFSDLYEIM